MSPCCHFYLKMSYSSTTQQNILKGNQQKFLSLTQRFECFPMSSCSNSIAFISCIGIPIPLFWLLCEYLLLQKLCCLLSKMWPYTAHSKSTKGGHEAQNDVWDPHCFRITHIAVLLTVKNLSQLHLMQKILLRINSISSILRIYSNIENIFPILRISKFTRPSIQLDLSITLTLCGCFKDIIAPLKSWQIK